MKLAERVAWGMAILGILFRILHWPMGSLLTVIGVSTAAVLYFPLGWALLGRPTRKDQLVPLSVLTGLVLSALSIGMLFKVQLWPRRMADLYLAMGLLGAVAVMAAILTLHSRNPGIEHYFQGLRRRLLLIGIPALLLYLTPVDAWVKVIHRNDPVRADLLIRLHRDPSDTLARRSLHQLDSTAQMR
jgi:hypothetical protein